MKIKISEIFYSAQGEGRFVGVPSVFLRTFGCNFTCGGFGMSRGTMSTERDQVDVKLYDRYEDLPLVNTGCDSYASWDPRFKHLSPTMLTHEIVDKMKALCPGGDWLVPNGNDVHLVITGGEPLLGWQRAYPDLLGHRLMGNLINLTFETNGTQALHEEFKDYLSVWLNENTKRELTFSVSAKLPCSGEKWEKAIKPQVVADYQEFGTVYLKFVIATEQDFEDAQRATKEYRKAGFTGHVYLMPVGGVESVYAMNNRRVADLAMSNGLRYSDRLQVPLFKNEWGT